MKQNFDQCFDWLLVHEGGYTNDPRDPGGITNLGVIATEWAAWTHAPATEKIMRSLTPDDVKPLYKAKYWDALHCDELPGGVDWAVMDFGVNSGVSRSAKCLQRMVNSDIDGVIGQNTLAAVQKADPKETLNAICDARQKFLESLSTFDHFGRGWLRRVAEVRRQAESLAT